MASTYIFHLSHNQVSMLSRPCKIYAICKYKRIEVKRSYVFANYFEALVDSELDAESKMAGHDIHIWLNADYLFTSLISTLSMS